MSPNTKANLIATRLSLESRLFTINHTTINKRSTLCTNTKWCHTLYRKARITANRL